MFGLVIIDSRGKQFSGEEQSAIRRAALALLKAGTSAQKVYFTHPICSGILKRENAGMFGTFAGTFFSAQTDAVDGVARSLSFLVPRASEHMTPGDYPENLVSEILTENGTELHFEPIHFEGAVDLHTLQ
jgi:hypothetical protein